MASPQPSGAGGRKRSPAKRLLLATPGLSKIARRVSDGRVATSQQHALATAYGDVLRRVGDADDPASSMSAAAIATLGPRALARLGEAVDGDSRTLTAALRAGEPLPRALVAYARAAGASGGAHADRARATLAALTGQAGAAAANGVLEFWAGTGDSAAAAFAACPAAERRTLAPVESSIAAWEAAGSVPTADVTALAKAGLGPEDWTALLAAMADLHAWKQVAAALKAVDTTNWPADVRGLAESLGGWATEALRAKPKAGTWRLGVIGQGNPNPRRASRDLGDDAATVALLKLALEGRAVRVAGPAELVAVAARALGAPATEPDSAVELALVLRDAASIPPPATPTWLLAHGDFPRAWFGTRTDFPYPAAVEPLYLSMRLSDLGRLDGKALEHLVAAGPVGCEDRRTHELLTAAGVSAFLAGPLADSLSPSDWSDASLASADPLARLAKATELAAAPAASVEVRALVAGTLDRLLRGEDAAEVRAHWREVTAPLVARDNARRGTASA